MKPVYIASANMVATIEGLSQSRCYIILKEMRKECGKAPMHIVSLYEYCAWKKTDYQMLMIDIRAGIFRRQFLQFEDIVNVEGCTERTAFNRMASMRKHYNLASNTSLLIRHYADFVGVPLEDVYNAQMLAKR